MVYSSKLRPTTNSPESVDEELFGDVVFAVGVLEGEVELVVAVQHPEAVLGLRPRTPLRAAAPVDVNLKATTTTRFQSEVRLRDPVYYSRIVYPVP